MTQSAAMAMSWHPAIRADWLVLRRTGWLAVARVVSAPVLLPVCCAAVACGDFFGGYGWCLAATALLALGGSHAIAHERLLGALERWRFGWCGALPIARGAVTATLLTVTAAALLASLAFATVLLTGASMPAPHRGDLPYALAGIDLGLVVGTASAAARVFRQGAIVRVHHADGIREPLLALPWLNDTRLPHLLDWQRRAALVRWRRGGGAAMAALALFAVPNGASMLRGAGLILLVLSLTWLDVALHACATATAEAARLLQPTPSGGDRLRTASLRYPLLAVVCTLVLAVAGAILISGGSAIAGLWGAAYAIAVSVWPLKRLRAAMGLSEPST
ncbi:MAG: hypothetical protein ACREPZ_02120 [Rhodanobacteraceae bacterium]